MREHSNRASTRQSFYCSLADFAQVLSPRSKINQSLLISRFSPWEDESDWSQKSTSNPEKALLIAATKLELLSLLWRLFLICSKLNCLHRLVQARARESPAPRFAQLIGYTRNGETLKYCSSLWNLRQLVAMLHKADYSNIYFSLQLRSVFAAAINTPCIVSGSTL